MKLVIAVACALFVLQGLEAKKLDILVLYESLCPDSMRFVKNQVTPSFPEIKDYVNLTYVPFGKAHYDENQQEFVCQHGSSECRGNLEMSCGLRELANQQDEVDFVGCFMREYYQNPMQCGQKCATEVGINWESVKQCIESDVGKQLQLAAQEVTHFFKPKFIPTVIYNDEFDQKAQDSSMNGFRNWVCAEIQKTYPEACSPVRLV